MILLLLLLLMLLHFEIFSWWPGFCRRGICCNDGCCGGHGRSLYVAVPTTFLRSIEDKRSPSGSEQVPIMQMLRQPFFRTLLFLGDLCDIALYLINLGSWYLYLQRSALYPFCANVSGRANLALAFTYARPHSTPIDHLRSREFRQPIGATFSRVFAR